LRDFFSGSGAAATGAAALANGERSGCGSGWGGKIRFGEFIVRGDLFFVA
jgi:hypothetical protein